MKVTLNRVNQDYLFEVTNDNGHKVLLDNKSKEEGKVGGISPMELLLAALGGCSSIDIVAILNKQKINPTDIKMDIEGSEVDVLSALNPSTFEKTDIIAENFSFGEESSSRIEESGSTKFGNDLGDVQNFTGSVKPNSIQFLNNTTSSLTEVSNDAGLTSNSQTAVVTEFAARKFYDGMDETPPFVRKNFVHKGTVINSTETHFSAITASAPFGFEPPSIKDFFVFQCFSLSRPFPNCLLYTSDAADE